MTGDFNNALRASEEIRKRYPRELIKDDPLKVLQYYQELIQMVEDGGLTRKQACFLIADTMTLNSVRFYKPIESIAIDAGCQELPDRHILGNPQERWMILTMWVDLILPNYLESD